MSKTTKWLKAIFIIVSLAAIAYCLAWFCFDLRLDYEVRKYLCGDDSLCKAQLWLEYKRK